MSIILRPLRGWSRVCIFAKFFLKRLDNRVEIGVFYMRRAIETVPRDGKVVILEDDTSGTFELAHWSAEARAWVRENGELSKITPTYWHPTRRDEYLLQEGDEFLLQKERGSSGPSAPRERRTLPFPPGRAAPQWTPAAGDNIALRQVA